SRSAACSRTPRPLPASTACRRLPTCGRPRSGCAPATACASTPSTASWSVSRSRSIPGMQRLALVLILALLPSSLSAQWLDFRTPGIPRTADGKPNLTAPAPRTPDGKPDLSGVWQPETNPYRFDLIDDPNDEHVFRPAAEAVFLKR